MAGGFLIAFIRSVRSGQFDDTCTPAMRILHDDNVTNTNNQDKNA